MRAAPVRVPNTSRSGGAYDSATSPPLRTTSPPARLHSSRYSTSPRVQYSDRLDRVLADVPPSTSPAPRSFDELERSLGLQAVTAEAAGSRQGFVFGGTSDFETPTAAGAAARAARLVARPEPAPEPELEQFDALSSPRPFNDTLWSSLGLSPVPDTVAPRPIDGYSQFPTPLAGSVAGGGNDGSIDSRVSGDGGSDLESSGTFVVGQRVRFRDLAGARVAATDATDVNVKIETYSVHIPGVGVVTGISGAELAPLTSAGAASPRQLPQLPMMSAGLPVSLSGLSFPAIPRTNSDADSPGVTEEDVAAISEEVSKQVQTALAENLDTLQRTLSASLGTQLQELASSVAEMSPKVAVAAVGAGDAGDESALKKAAAAELYNSERQRATADVALLVAEQAKEQAQAELVAEREKSQADSVAAQERTRGAEAETAARFVEMETRLAAEQDRARASASEAAAAKDSLEADWEERMASTERDKVERIQKLDEQMAAREADAERFLNEAKEEAAAAVADQKRVADEEIKAREGKLREMEMDFLRQQHKSRHLERLAKMKLGTAVEKHAFSSTKESQRVVMLSEDQTTITWGKTAKDAKTGAAHKKGLQVNDLTDVYLGTKSPLLTQRSRQGLIVVPESQCVSLVGTERSFDMTLPKDADVTLWVLGMRTLVGEAQPDHNWKMDALEYGKFLWERALMRVRAVAPLDDLLAAMREEVGLDVSGEASSPRPVGGRARTTTLMGGAASGNVETLVDAATIRKVLGNFGEVLPQEAADEMVFEGDTSGVGHLTYVQFAQHVTDFVKSCLDADQKAAAIVANAVRGDPKRISNKELKEQAKMLKKADDIDVGAEYTLLRDLTTRARQTLDSEEVASLTVGTVVVILQAEVETAGKEKIVRVRTSEGWLTYKKAWLQLVGVDEVDEEGEAGD